MKKRILAFGCIGITGILLSVIIGTLKSRKSRKQKEGMFMKQGTIKEEVLNVNGNDHRLRLSLCIDDMGEVYYFDLDRCSLMEVYDKKQALRLYQMVHDHIEEFI